jgi:hypothetical protein
MQLVSDGKAVRIDIEPQPDDERKDLIRQAPALCDIPDEELIFHDLTPTEGNPFTEINCGTIKTGAEYRGLKLDESALAGQIADILREHGDNVELDPVIKPIEQSGYMFTGLTTERP